ncbi:hypothetical protein [Acinetobacter pollinis]|uniref:hypothetical protein n=1 Tax=Acinetobacter pollinis TaxID=2605270 RepID=UPI0018A2F19C|nr:hypothetical protein [Acinetobacter pollinis]MBF7689355.1 hypothetical protein [Acinetobacter pollinis]MBF7692002.1 hypothetical protein [Acinetobacter pollinis]MBF7697050.1 hypothetical protein [Acinetobacter pollinis]MBF7700441.1 hypothetical protein [Acinetobacter pollinis]
MAKKTVNIGANANDGSGNAARSALQHVLQYNVSDPTHGKGGLIKDDLSGS